MQNEMQSERAEVGRQRDQLETDRRDWDQRERRDAGLVAAVISSACYCWSVDYRSLWWPCCYGLGMLRPTMDPVCSVLLDELVLHSELDAKRIWR